MFFTNILFLFLAAKYLLCDSQAPSELSYNFDLVIGGGSLSALAAAITAANVTKQLKSDLKIALIEPTDWPGGQLTASNVPPDFGPYNGKTVNLPQDFVSILNAVAGPSWSTNPGKCWVSYKCFEAQKAASYIRDLLKSFEPHLTVFYNTVIKATEVENSKIKKIVAIQRFPATNTTGYEYPLSKDFLDWYSYEPSTIFPSKSILKFIDPIVVIEGTELGDIMMSSGLSGVVQGVESPEETSDTTDSTCGQSSVLPFHMYYHPDESKSDTEDDQYPSGNDYGYPFSMGNLNWAQIWTYRRVLGLGDGSSEHIYPEEISNQNYNNEYYGGYILSVLSPIAKYSDAEWNGGLNTTVLSNLENRGYGWYRYLLDNSSSAKDTLTGKPLSPSLISLSKEQVGTNHGLAKVPYLRDTRRSQYGIDHFRLLYYHLNYSNPEDNGATAYHFPDTVGIGDYHYADIHGLDAEHVCADKSYPEYIICCDHPVKPYYLPFRAITFEGMDNLLVAGKSMAQSFLANAATRLHPIEWSSGAAAGAAAFGMIKGYNSHRSPWGTTQQVYDKHIPQLQQLLSSDIIKSPLSWKL